MTQHEWLTLDDPGELIAFALARRPSQRKCRLFCVACARRSTYRFGDPDEEAESVAVADLAERFADGLASTEELAAASRCRNCDPEEDATWVVADYDADQAARSYARYHDDTEYPQANKASLVRDLFGDPFRDPAFDPRWRTPTVSSLALAAYEERLPHPCDLDPVRLGILADALEDAGCTDEAVLEHLRSAGPHVRGCGVIDLILGKE
jgi:hypothetical protein